MELIVPQTTLQDDEAVQGRQPLTIEEVSPSILIQNEDYCVINKPPAVRMDGNFPVTIDKVVASWIGTDTKSLKWVHQLDFATSGALCIALNREAAAAVVSAFEHRTVKKNYLAVLQGHVNIDAWAVREQSEQQTETHDTLLDEYRSELIATNKKAKRKLAEVENEQKNIVLWQTSVMEQNLQSCLTAFASYTPTTSNLSEQIVNEYNQLKDISEEKYRQNAKCRKQLRRFLQKVGIEVDIIDSNNAENAVVKVPDHVKPNIAAFTVNDSVNNSGPIPLTLEELEAICAGYRSGEKGAIFRLPPSSSTSSAPTERLIIDIPVAELDGDFRMEPGHDRNAGRRAVTELQILEYGQYQGQPVTKVLFKPISGRRHQLRIHALCLGYPIVGDFTYNQYHRQAALASSSSRSSSSSSCSSSGPIVTAERMMLHAHGLTVPFPNFGKCSLPFKRKWLFKEMKASNQKSNQEKLSDEEIWEKIMSYDSTTLRLTEIKIPLVDNIADDPFIFDENNELKPSLPAYMQKSKATN